MRFDETGMFWDDYVAPRVPVEKIVRTPPDPVWLRDDYLPALDEAKAYKFNLMTDAELIGAALNKERFVWDTEFYPNYATLGFMHLPSRKMVKHSFRAGETLPDRDRLLWIARNLLIIGFNDTKFDIPMLMVTLAGYTTEQLMGAVIDLIRGGEFESGMDTREFYKKHKTKPFPINHIDLIALTPLGPSLKVCAGRMHSQRMADLPFPPEKVLSEDQQKILDYYWVNDLENTALLYEKNKTAIELREHLTNEYKVDVRSKSDPQIAEAVIRTEIKRIGKQEYIERAEIEPGRGFHYHPPHYAQFQTLHMQQMLNFIRAQIFIVDQWGSPTMPEGLEKLDIQLGNATYRMGIGGLHSQEKRAIHAAGTDFEISDNDVTSYYPSLILQQGMFPPNVGPVFLQVFKRIYDRRLAAKKGGDKATAETLKIVLNGTFGKTGERGGHSVVYYPEMMIQITLSGQLALLMLIEALEISGIEVLSANTDGIVVKCHRSKLDLKKQIFSWWETTTGLGLESVEYKAIYSRDVNNYIAIYDKPKDGKNAFRHAKAIGAYRQTLDVYPLKWNPTCEICSEAVIEYLATGKPMDQTIRECADIRKFIEVRRVTGGACKDGEYLGKVIRWYYAQGENAEIINAKNGHVVPRSKGARPCMILPASIPEDLDFDYYATRAQNALEDFFEKKKSNKNKALEEKQA